MVDDKSLLTVDMENSLFDTIMFSTDIEIKEATDWAINFTIDVDRLLSGINREDDIEAIIGNIRNAFLNAIDLE